jgi:hypothetical protein
MHPCGNRIRKFFQDLAVCAPRPDEYVKGMVRTVDYVQRGAIIQPRNRRPHESYVGERIASPLQEQHREADVVKVTCPLDVRLACRVQRKAHEHQPAYAVKRMQSLRLRGHSPAKGLTAGKQPQPRKSHGCLMDSRTNSGVRRRGRIGSADSFFHVGELVPQRRNTTLEQGRRQIAHERVIHARASPVREDKDCQRFAGNPQDR